MSTKAITPVPPSERFFQISTTFLTATVWTSALIFGLYILTFYFVAYFNGNVGQWNRILPGLYDADNSASTAGIGLHFLAGGIILILGCMQMIGSIREKYPLIHRISGRIYILASLLTAVGGLVFIAYKGTVGGTVMDIGFTGYGLLMGWAAVETARHARAGRMDKHRAWGIRLFALAIGSWLYRMDYGFYIGFGGSAGHTDDFTGWFDYFMDFWFYLPNLIVAELIIGRYAFFQRPAVKVIGSVFMVLASLLLCFASFVFIRDFWGPGILSAF